MNKSPFIMLLVVVALAGATAMACTYMKSHRRLGNPGVRLVARPSLDTEGRVVRAESVLLPEHVLNYTAQVQPITLEELQTLPEDTIFGRSLYRAPAPDAFEVMLGAVLMGVDSRSIHKPEICLPAQGWRIREEVATVTLEQPVHQELPVMKVFAEKNYRAADGREQPIVAVVVYWFVSERGATASHAERMWQMGSEILRTGTLQRWALLSCSTFCSPGQEQQSFERLKQFLAAAVPQFQIAAVTNLPGPAIPVTNSF